MKNFLIPLVFAGLAGCTSTSRDLGRDASAIPAPHTLKEPGTVNTSRDTGNPPTTLNSPIAAARAPSRQRGPKNAARSTRAAFPI
jgi:hypothetical protein